MHDPIYDIFSEEAKEHLGALETGFLDLETAALTAARRDQIDNLFRHAHTLKGDARAVGVPALQDAAQQLEDILDALRNNPEKINRDAINQGLAQLDQARHAFENWQRSLGEEKPAVEPFPLAPEPVLSGQPRVTDAGPADSPQPGATAPSHTAATQEESFTVRVPSDRLDRMLSLAGELRIVQRSGEILSHRLIDLKRLLSDALGRFQQLEHVVRQDHDIQESPGSAEREVAGFRPLLEVCREQVERVVSSLRRQRNREDILLETLEGDIQQARLLPLVMLADSLRRVVRDLSQSLGKPIRYEADVGTILLDKAVLEALREPMLHLLRNAASHGIEAPQERRSAGKSPEGVIRLHAMRAGNTVRILLADDGRGVNYDHIRARVRQTAALSESELSALTTPELTRYLFRPGFTTAGSKDTFSGRGVGLDVASHTVSRLHGSIEIDSTSSQGTTFAITVPVSISTMRIVTVLSDGQYYGIPSSLIEKTGRAKLADLRDLQGCRVLPLNAEPVRWLALRTLLGTTPPGNLAGDAYAAYVLIHQHGKPVAVAVDDLEEEAEILLKPLGFPLRDLPGLMGAAVRPDGSVQLVLDLSSPFLEPAVGPSTSSSAWGSRMPEEGKPARRILVVDDSPTTRAIMRNVLTAAGYVARTATDGVDALERLRVEPADLVLSDVEMPRMDGFELVRQIKAKHRLPVILVTGMEKEDQRRKGLEAGADAYVVKSTFQGESLLQIVKQFV